MAIPIEKKLKKKNLVLTYQLEGNAVRFFFLPDFEIIGVTVFGQHAIYQRAKEARFQFYN